MRYRKFSVSYVNALVFCQSTKAIAKLGEDRLKMSIAETMQAMRYSISEIDKLLSVSGEVLVDEVEAVINSMYRSDVKLYAHRVELQLLGHQSKLTTNRIISDLHKLQANGTDMDREQAVTSVLEGTLGLINDVSPSLDAIQKVFIEVMTLETPHILFSIRTFNV